MIDYINDYPYPLNLVNAVCMERLVERELPADFLRGLDYAIANLQDPRMAEMLRLRFRDKRSYREIGEQYGLTAQHVRQITEKGMKQLRHPDNYRYIRRGYAEAKRCEVEREERAAWETARREAAAEALEKGKNAGPLHEIGDISLRLDAILARSELAGFDLHHLRLTHELYCALFERRIVKLWQVCFLTPEAVASLMDGDASAAALLKKRMARLGLELDDGTLSADPQTFELAKDRFFNYLQILGR